MARVAVRPEMFRWARAGLGPGALAGRFPSLDAWERGEVQPTLKQLAGAEETGNLPRARP